MGNTRNQKPKTTKDEPQAMDISELLSALELRSVESRIELDPNKAARLRRILARVTGKPEAAPEEGFVIKRQIAMRNDDGSLPVWRFFSMLLAHICPLHDYEAPSIQKSILNALPSGPKEEALARFEEAKYSSLLVCCNLCGQLLFGKNWITNPAQIQNKLLSRLICLENASLCSSGVQSCVEDPHFIEQFRKELRNWKHRTKKFGFAGGHLIDLARCWTAPDLPLWMMSNEAGFKMLSYVCYGNLVAFEKNNFAKMVERGNLARFDRFLITDACFTKSDSGGYMLRRYVFSKEASKHLKTV